MEPHLRQGWHSFLLIKSTILVLTSRPIIVSHTNHSFSKFNTKDGEAVVRIRPDHEDAYDMKNSKNMSFTEILSAVAGHGLMLGNDEVWIFESVSLEGYSVIHLARSTSRINWS